MSNQWRRESMMTMKNQNVKASTIINRDDSLHDLVLKKSWKKMIRKGVPNGEFHDVFSQLFAIGNSQKYYEVAWESVFGAEIPTTFNRGSPTFSDKQFPEIVQRIYIKGDLIELKRVLWVINQSWPMVKYCPMLTSLIALLFIYFDESEVYTMVSKIINHSQYHNHEANIRWHVTLTEQGNKKMMGAFHDIMKRDQKFLMNHFQNIGFDFLAFLPNWFDGLFVGYLNSLFISRILAAYLSEGIKVVFRVAYVLFGEIDKYILTEKDPNKIEALIREQCNALCNVDQLIKAAFKAWLTEKNNRFSRQLSSNFKRKKLPVFYRPLVAFSSSILQTDDFEAIWENFGVSLRLYNPQLVFSSERDGSTLSSLLRAAGAQKQCQASLIALKTEDGSVIGAVISEELQTTRDYIAWDDCMVFQLHPEENFYNPTGDNEMYIHITDRILIIGGGGEGPALTIGENLDTCTSSS